VSFVENMLLKDIAVNELREDKMRWLAHKLHAMQANRNGGRGISLVSKIAALFNRGREAEARAMILSEWDKISDYPKIAEFLTKQELTTPPG